MPEINNLDDFIREYTKPEPKTIKIEVEYYESKKTVLENTINQITELAANKKDIPYNLINEFVRCFPFFPSVKNYPLNYFELRNTEIEELLADVKKEFTDYKIDYDKYAPKKRQKILDTFLGHTAYVDTIYKGHNFGNFLNLYVLRSHHKEITGLSPKQKEKIIIDILHHVQAFEVIKAVKGVQFKQQAFTGYIAYKLNLFPKPVKLNEYWSKSEFRKALVDKIAYVLEKDQ